MSSLAPHLRLLPAAALLLGVGCDFSSKGDPTDGGPRDDDPPAVAAELELDERGGIVAVTDHRSPLFGATVTLPPGALSRRVTVSLAEAEELPEGSTTLGIGAVLDASAGDVELALPAVVELPLPAGAPADGVGAGRWDASAEGWEGASGEVRRYDDPEDEVGARIVFSTRDLGLFRVIYRDQQPVRVRNDGSGPLEVSVAAFRYETQAGRMYTPVPPVDFRRMLEPGEHGDLHLLPGEYVLHGTFDGESVPRCERVQVVDPVSSTEPLGVVMTDATAPCTQPAVRLSTSDDTVQTGGDVVLRATPTSAGASTIDWSWSATGGAIAGPITGTTDSGEMVEATWTGPDGEGVYHVYFVATLEDGWFSEGVARIEVSGPNQTPRIASFEAMPAAVGPGFPEGARGVAEPGFPGVTRLRVVSSDLDGDPLLHYWEHPLPGNFYDVESGVKLERDEERGIVVWPESEDAYTQSSIFYMAPPETVVEGFERGAWLPFAVTASDGSSRDRSWLMTAVLSEVGSPPPADAGAGMDAGPGPRDAGRRDAGRPDAGSTDAGVGITGRCIDVTSGLCTMYVGSAWATQRDTLEADCAATWADGVACPESGATGACYRFPGEDREVADVHYVMGATSMDITRLQMECEAIPIAEGGPGEWQRPYRAP